MPKNPSDFSVDRYKQDGLSHRCKTCRRAHYLANKPAAQKQASDWHGRNKERANARALNYYHRNRETQARRMAAWYKNNRDRVLAVTAEYRRQNPEQNAAWRAKRRAAERQATPVWADFDAILVMYETSARLTRETGISHNVDHIVPLQSPLVCGLHWEGNMQVLTAAENVAKSNRIWPDMP